MQKMQAQSLADLVKDVHEARRRAWSQLVKFSSPDHIAK